MQKLMRSRGGDNAGYTGNAVIAIGYESQTRVSSSITVGGMIAIGNKAIAGLSYKSTEITDSIAIGQLSRASGQYSIALGNSTFVTGTRASAFGVAATAIGERSIALGNSANASAFSATAVGRATKASGESSVALGEFAEATATSSVAIGASAKAIAAFGVAMGHEASAAEGALALGHKANASHLNSLALGSEAQALAESSVALGHGAKSAGLKSIAIGYQAVVGVGSDGATDGIAIGDSAKVTSTSGLAVGRETEAANAAAAFGRSAKATATGALALGRLATASASSSTAIGYEAISSAQYAVALGRKSEATALSALAFGTNAHANGEHSISIGTGSSAIEAGGVALGQNSVANTAAGIAGYIPTGAGKSNAEAVTATTSTLAAVAVGDAATGNLRQITGVAAGTNDTDVVNVAQLKAVSAAVGGSFELSADGKNATTVGTGDAIDLKNEDGNIVVSKLEDTNDVTFDLADDITAESVTTGNAQLNNAGLSVDDGTNKTTYGANGFIIDGGPSVTADGIDAGGKTIANIASGDVSADSTDAITGSQLFATNQIVDGLGGRVDIVEGDVTNIQNDITNISNVTQEIAEGKSGVVQRTGIDDVVVLTADGGNGEEPGAAQKLTNLADGDVSEFSTDAINGSQLFASNEKIDTIAANTSAYLGGGADVADGVAPSFTVQGNEYNNIGDAVGAADGKLTELDTSVDNINVTLDNIAEGKSGVVQRSPDEDVAVLTAVGGNGEEPGAAQKLTNLADGDVSEFSTDAINGSQLFASNEKIDTIAANTSAYLGGGADVANGVAPSFTVQGTEYNNIGDAVGAVDSDLTTLHASVVSGTAGIVQRSADEDDVAVLTAVGGNGEEPGAAQKLTNLADGKVSEDSTDAINGSQLFATNQIVGDLDGRVGLVEGDVSTIQNDITNITNVTQEIAEGKSGVVQRTGVEDVVVLTADGHDGDAPGAAQKLTNLAAGKVSADSTDAINGSQLFVSNEKIDTIAANTSAYLGGGADVANGVAPSFTVQDKQYNNIGDAVGAVDSNLTTLHASVVSGTAGIVQRSAGEDDVAVLTAVGHDGEEPGAAQKLTNLADGKVSEDSTDAINGSQLFATNQRVEGLDGRVDIVEGNVSTIQNDITNISNVTQEIAEGKSGVVQRSPDEDVAVLTAVGGNGDAPGAAQKLTNLAAGMITADSTDAINGSQIYNVSTRIAAAFGGGATVNPDGSFSAPIYTVQEKQYNNIGDAVGAVDSNLTTLHASVVSGTAGVVQRTGVEDVVVLTADGGTGDEPGAAQKLTNLAAGKVSEDSTDAINGSQLFASYQRMDLLAANTSLYLGGGADVVNGVAPTYTIDGKQFASVGSAFDAVDGSLQALDGRIKAINNGTNSGTATGDDSVAAGDSAVAEGDSSVAIGDDSHAKGDNSVAIGDDSQAVGDNSVAIGDDSHAVGDNSVAVGKDANSGGSSSVAVGENATSDGNSSVAVGDNASSSGNSSVAVGENATSDGNSSVAIGDNATSGGNSSVAIGDNANAQADNSIALGKDAVANNEGDVALGSGSVTSDAVATKDLTINGKTYDVAGTDPKNTVSVGDVGSERTITNVAAGRVSEDSTDAVNGSQLHAAKQAIEDLGGQVANATTATKNAIQYDTDSNGNRLNSVTLQGGDENAPVVLSNVAAGTKDTDAVNVKQLSEKSEETLAIAKDYSDIKSEETLVLAKNYTKSYVDERQVNTLSEANRYTDEKFGMLSSEIGDVRKEARQAAAIGLAAASLRFDDRPGKLSAAIGGGTWRGAGAAAFGLGYTSHDQRMRASVTATTAGGHWGVGAGLSFTLN